MICAKTESYPSSLHQIKKEKSLFTKILSFSYNLYNKKNDYPEIDMNATKLITSKGLPAEEHYVTTKDGYILGMQRIPQLKQTGKLPVLIMHGLLSSSEGFLLNSEDQSLAFVLYHLGYDVWLGNVRGNKFSRNHLHLDPGKDAKFWKWSFDEMGQYDIPAMVDYILNHTKQQKLNYIGHSQGTVALVVSAITQGPEFKKKISNFFALAPAVYLANMTSPLKHFTGLAQTTKHLIELFDNGEILPSNKQNSWLQTAFCKTLPETCENLAFTIFGSQSKFINEARLPVYVAHDPSGTSVQNMVHWSQIIDQNNFELSYYDYGSDESNYQHYRQKKPPVYNISLFDIPTYIFCGTSDTVVNITNCQKLAVKLPRAMRLFEIPDYSHIDFLYAIDARTKVYQHIIDILN